MDRDTLLVQIQQCVEENKISLKKHALVRMVERHISTEDLLNGLKSCLVIEEYPKDRPLPSYLVLGFSGNKPIHAVIAVENRTMVWVITVYVPSEEKWKDNYRIRRKKQ